jgi:hypothetical protein
MKMTSDPGVVAATGFGYAGVVVATGFGYAGAARVILTGAARAILTGAARATWTCSCCGWAAAPAATLHAQTPPPVPAPAATVSVTATATVPPSSLGFGVQSSAAAGAACLCLPQRVCGARAVLGRPWSTLGRTWCLFGTQRGRTITFTMTGSRTHSTACRLPQPRPLPPPPPPTVRRPPPARCVHSAQCMRARWQTARHVAGSAYSLGVGRSGAAAADVERERTAFDALLLEDLSRINGFFLRKLNTLRGIWADLQRKVGANKPYPFHHPSQADLGRSVSPLLSLSLSIVLCLSVCLSVCLCVCVSVCLSVCLSLSRTPLYRRPRGRRPSCRRRSGTHWRPSFMRSMLSSVCSATSPLSTTPALPRCVL